MKLVSTILLVLSRRYKTFFLEWWAQVATKYWMVILVLVAVNTSASHDKPSFLISFLFDILLDPEDGGIIYSGMSDYSGVYVITRQRTVIFTERIFYLKKNYLNHICHVDWRRKWCLSPHRNFCYKIIVLKLDFQIWGRYMVSLTNKKSCHVLMSRDCTVYTLIFVMMPYVLHNS